MSEILTPELTFTKSKAKIILKTKNKKKESLIVEGPVQHEIDRKIFDKCKL